MSLMTLLRVVYPDQNTCRMLFNRVLAIKLICIFPISTIPSNLFKDSYVFPSLIILHSSSSTGNNLCLFLIFSAPQNCFSIEISKKLCYGIIKAKLTGALCNLFKKKYFHIIWFLLRLSILLVVLCLEFGILIRMLKQTKGNDILNTRKNFAMPSTAEWNMYFLH